jgi:hypothetical protein
MKNLEEPWISLSGFLLCEIARRYSRCEHDKQENSHKKIAARERFAVD